VTNPTTIRTLSGNATFTIAADRQTIIQSANGKSYTWNNAGLPKAITPPRPRQVTPSATSSSSRTSYTPVASQTRSPAEEFRNLRRTEEQMIAKEMININNRDKSSLELLEKRVGISNIRLQEKIVGALQAVKESRDFGADEPDKNRKLSAHEKDFWGIKQNRDKRIREMRKNIANRLKSTYQAIFRRAATAKDFGTAREIEEMLKQRASSDSQGTSADSFGPFEGTWGHGGESFSIDVEGQIQGRGKGRREGTRDINFGDWKLRLSKKGDALVEVTITPGKVWKRIGTK
jgi:hypothetical protein